MQPVKGREQLAGIGYCIDPNGGYSRSLVKSMHNKDLGR